ncbi:putative ribonuclease H-like domain-containing protein [Tanacetum coccineum]
MNNFENASKSLDKLIGSQISDNSRKGLRYNVVPPPPMGLFAPPSIDLSNYGVEEFKQPEFEGYAGKVNKSVCENSSNEIKKTPYAPIIKQANQPKIPLININLSKLINLGKSFNHLIKHCDFRDKKMVQKHVMNNVRKGTGQREVRPVWNNVMRTNHQNFSNSRRNFATTAVLTKSGIVPISTARQSSLRVAAPVCAARPINTATSKPLVNVAKPRTNAFRKSHSLSRRPFYQQIALKNRILNNKVNTAKINSINTAKGTRVTSAIGKQGINGVKSSADSCDPQVALKDTGIFDNGCSRHMTGNKCYLIVYQDYDGGFVAFAGSSKEGKIIRKGKIRTGNLDFEDVYFVKELKFNLFSVSQMRDKKNSVLFTETECLILSPDFKLPDENQVVLKIPRKDNMYSFDLKNIVHSKVTILNTLDHLGKFDGKADKGVLVGYSINSKAFRVYNHRTKIVEENMYVNFLENKPNVTGNRPEWLFDIDSLTNTMNYQPVSAGNRTNSNAGIETNSEEDVSSPNDDAADKKIEQESAKEEAQILMDAVNHEKEATEHSDDVKNQFKAEYNKHLFEGLDTRTSSTNSFNTVNNSIYTASTSLPVDVHNYPDDLFMPNLKDTAEPQEADFNNMEPSIVEPKKVTQALDDESWVEAMQEELLQFKLLNVWTLVDLPHGKKAIDKKKMDVKNAFLYGTIEEEVYVSQPPGFVDPEFPNKVSKVEKALYGLHQAPRTWYETLSNYLLENGFRRGTIDKTLFIKKIKNYILLVQVYVDDIIFGSTKKSLSTEFEQLMHKRFQMSSIGELTFFLGLQVEQRKDGIFLSQDKYVYDILKKFGFSSVKTASTRMETHKSLSTNAAETDVDVHLYRSMIGSLMYLTSSRPDIMFAVCACSRFQVQPKASHMHAVKRIFRRYLKGQPTLGLWYPQDLPFDLIAYSDSDYTGASIDRKSTTGGCQFLGCRLISWQYKKQTIVANSTTEAEYIAASNCYG